MKKAFDLRSPLASISASAGTWAAGNTSNVPSLGRSAQGAASNVLTIPLLANCPIVKDGKQIGIRPLKVKAQFSVGVAALTQAPTIAVYKTSALGTAAPTATALTGTLSGYTAATGNQVITYDLAYLGEALFDINSNFHAELTVNPDTTTTIALYDVVFVYELVENAQD